HSVGWSAPVARYPQPGGAPAFDTAPRGAVLTCETEDREPKMHRPTPKSGHPWRRLLADRRGATAIEYGLMVALIGLTIIGTVSAAGQAIKDTLYGQIVNA